MDKQDKIAIWIVGIIFIAMIIGYIVNQPAMVKFWDSFDRIMGVEER